MISIATFNHFTFSWKILNGIDCFLNNVTKLYFVNWTLLLSTSLYYTFLFASNALLQKLLPPGNRVTSYRSISEISPSTFPKLVFSDLGNIVLILESYSWKQAYRKISIQNEIIRNWKKDFTLVPLSLHYSHRHHKFVLVYSYILQTRYIPSIAILPIIRLQILDFSPYHIVFDAILSSLEAPYHVKQLGREGHHICEYCKCQMKNILWFVFILSLKLIFSWQSFPRSIIALLSSDQPSFFSWDIYKHLFSIESWMKFWIVSIPYMT